MEVVLKADELKTEKKNDGKEKVLRSQGDPELKDVSLSPWQSFLEMIGFRAGGRDHEMHSFFTFAPLHN